MEALRAANRSFAEVIRYYLTEKIQIRLQPLNVTIMLTLHLLVSPDCARDGVSTPLSCVRTFYKIGVNNYVKELRT